MQNTYAQKQKTAQKKDASTAAAVLDTSSQSEGLQRKADMANGAAQREETPRPNNTGMPDNLKSGIESLSGFSMDDVRVHYNSSKPATVQALAYTQGTDIHVAPGQEKHLPHEAWHVAQQMAGRVSPTTNINGMPVNDNAALEHEADVMGEKAIGQRMESHISVDQFKNTTDSNSSDAMQCAKERISSGPNTYFDLSHVPGYRRTQKLKEKLTNIIDVMFNRQRKDETDDEIVVVVIPSDKKMTDLPEFSGMAGDDTGGVGGYRAWENVRGCGGYQCPGTRVVYVGVTEENLLGTFNRIEQEDDHYPKGYSVATHEIAHSIHMHRMNDDEKQTIHRLYIDKMERTVDSDIWPDGPCLNTEDENVKKTILSDLKLAADFSNVIAKDVITNDLIKEKMCYASQTEYEYYAQSVNTFLGTNVGFDPFTQKRRHNEKSWLQMHDPEMFEILKKQYGEKTKIQDANPLRSPEERLWDALRAQMPKQQDEDETTSEEWEDSSFAPESGSDRILRPLPLIPGKTPEERLWNALRARLRQMGDEVTSEEWEDEDKATSEEWNLRKNKRIPSYLRNRKV